ncbi:hypothetical protein M409DRAFT_18620 [Zasmidium cellare ATCC 36951]|uniref:Uncharacterized protein n=1 Tax=Zasmidium cellare ATCC 36951 TaxID=1080233 RepID=A0A6A6D1I8_ZASCE|nr:uncharacterized protein M409DRAFT_18620 [Zasmidium cellare ATCC 36951]KAF2171506.1 hypothetical protein M409DRAFT_18620 [Zasmidium cellare ATCC 36951]
MSTYRGQVGCMQTPGLCIVWLCVTRPWAVFLSQQDMNDLFRPVEDEIIGLMARQVESARNGGRVIDRVVLVGGFGEFFHLHERVTAWCREHGIGPVVSPEHPETAIVRGAALRGLQGAILYERRSNRHYGFLVSMPSREGIDPSSAAVFDNLTGNKTCSGRMQWFISKGEDMYTNRHIDLVHTWSRRNSLTTQVSIFSCSLDTAPEHMEHPQVEKLGKILIDFTGMDESTLSRGVSRSTSSTLMVRYQLQVSLDQRTGDMDFQTLVDGDKVGKASMVFG